MTVTTNNRTYLNTKDGLSQNIYVEQGDKTYIVKRPGTYKILDHGAATGVARGWIYSNAHNRYYIVIGVKLWSINSTLTTFTDITPATPPSNASSPVYFTETQHGANTSVMLHQPGAVGQLWEIVNTGSGVATLVTSSWTSATTVGAVVSLDTTLYTLSNTSNATTIQGSTLSDPTTWNVLNAINAYIYPDFGITLAKFRNQLVCFKQTSTEFFYDAANTPPGSPLSRIVEAALPIGCASAPSVVAINDSLVWMSKDQNGGLGFYSMGPGGVQKISTTYVDRTLASVEAIVNTGVVQASYLSFEGHKFYIVSIDGTVPGNQAIAGIAVAGKAVTGISAGASSFTRTLVYDLTTQHWFEWTSTDNTGAQTSFFTSFCISGSSVSSTQSYSNALMLNKANGDVYEISPPAIGSVNPTVYQDINAIQVKIVTNKLDGGTRNRKKISLLEIHGDKDTTANVLSVRYSDDDYNTWSTARTMDLSQRSFLTNLGMFRNRAFEFTHTANRPLRLEAFEVNVEMMDH